MHDVYIVYVFVMMLQKLCHWSRYLHNMPTKKWRKLSGNFLQFIYLQL